jgi:hypothetical protein
VSQIVKFIDTIGNAKYVTQRPAVMRYGDGHTSSLQEKSRQELRETGADERTTRRGFGVAIA